MLKQYLLSFLILLFLSSSLVVLLILADCVTQTAVITLSLALLPTAVINTD